MYHIDRTKTIYAIFPYDKSGRIAGVYVGSAKHIEDRIQAHKGCHSTKRHDDPQDELHTMMRENGFIYRKLATADFYNRWLEYVWIDIFIRYTSLRVFNKLIGDYGCERASTVYKKYWGSPSTNPLSNETRGKSNETLH